MIALRSSILFHPLCFFFFLGSLDTNEKCDTGWGRKLAYCIAFSADGGATDVTRRYVRDPLAQALPRTRVPEAVLAHTIEHIRLSRRSNLTTVQRERLEAEDVTENNELFGFFFFAMMPAVGEFLRKVTPFPLGTELPRLQSYALSRAQRTSIQTFRATMLPSRLASSHAIPPAVPRPGPGVLHPRLLNSDVVVNAPNSVTSTIVHTSSDLINVGDEAAKRAESDRTENTARSPDFLGSRGRSMG